MALLFLKNLVAPRERNYTPLELNTRHDLESPATASFLPATPGPRASMDDSDSEDGGAEKDGLSDMGSVTGSSDGGAESAAANFRAHLICNFTIGFSDGLTVPFAVTTGLSALGKPKVVIFGGLSDLVAGTISMGMGGYLGAKGEVDAYTATLTSTRQTVQSDPSTTSALISQTLGTAHIPRALRGPIISHLTSTEELAIDFLMRFHHQRPPSAFPQHYALLSGLVLSAGYLSGGIVPLLPYLFMPTIDAAFVFSIIVTACVLVVFGIGKTRIVGEKDPWLCARGGIEMLVLGGCAAGAAVGCVKAFS